MWVIGDRKENVCTLFSWQSSCALDYFLDSYFISMHGIPYFPKRQEMKQVCCDIEHFQNYIGSGIKKCQVAGRYWVPVGPWCSRGKVLCCRQKNLAGNCFCRLVQCYHRVFNMYFSTPHLRNLRYSATIPFQNAPITFWLGHWPNTVKQS